MTDARRWLALAAGVLLSAALLYGLSTRLAGIPPLGTLLDPADGLYQTARQATATADSTTLRLPALEGPVTVVRDERGVPHIFAERDRDAIVALGYVVAQDRLFQMDFIARVASGRLAAALGEQAVSADRFLRRTGMEWGAQKNLRRIREQGGLEWRLLQWYTAGVNAYAGSLDRSELPFEFRLLGYEPMTYRPLQAMRVLQYMAYDLTYRSDDADYATLRQRLDSTAYQELYPNEPVGLYVPIVPPKESEGSQNSAQATAASPDAGPPAEGSFRRRAAASEASPTWAQAALDRLRAHHQQQERLDGTLAAGFEPGKGSNNWAVHAGRSATGAPILAGDMHLSLTLPSIWYEVHLATPSMNTYGVTVPGAPLPVEAFTDHVGWAFTNTGADQIDHLALELDSTRQRYRYEGGWRDLRQQIDTIAVNHGAPVVDTLHYSHHGPVLMGDRRPDVMGPDGAVALRWVAHDSSRTLQALWGMNHATNLAEFEEALRSWDTPMQNILYGGTDGHIAIRSTGHLPVRRAGHGRGLLDGSTDRFAWTGRVPFEELPYARDPAQGFLTSSNQKPTGSDYPHYLNHDWRDGYRSLRLDTLLRSQPQHSVDDLKRYQSDVDAMQRDVFVPLLRPLTGLSARADTLRRMLRRWNGVASLDRPEPLVFEIFLDVLRRMAWDESTFEGVPNPEDAPFVDLMRTRPEAPWFDVQATDSVQEDAQGLLARALETTVDSLETGYGWGAENWRWGDHHGIEFRHLTGSAALRPLWRGPYPYPGFTQTVSPAGARRTTKSASWRVVVDFSTDPVQAYGIYPGGQSGNPFHPRLYDLHVEPYVNFEHYRLRHPSVPDSLSAAERYGTLHLQPGGK